jgi:hypothetical protein
VIERIASSPINSQTDRGESLRKSLREKNNEKNFHGADLPGEIEHAVEHMQRGDEEEYEDGRESHGRRRLAGRRRSAWGVWMVVVGSSWLGLPCRRLVLDVVQSYPSVAAHQPQSTVQIVSGDQIGSGSTLKGKAPSGEARAKSMASSSAEKKTAAEVVAALDLHRHPDGGFYLETFRDSSISLPKSALPPQCKPTFVVGSFV